LGSLKLLDVVAIIAGPVLTIERCCNDQLDVRLQEGLGLQRPNAS
jgi:hypothetical protein